MTTATNRKTAPTQEFGVFLGNIGTRKINIVCQVMNNEAIMLAQLYLSFNVLTAISELRRKTRFVIINPHIAINKYALTGIGLNFFLNQ